MLKRKHIANKSASSNRSGIDLLSRLPLGAAAGAAIIAAVVFAAYLPCINGGFLSDDYEVFLARNQATTSSGDLYRFWCTTKPIDYWPVTYTMFWIEWRLWGMNPTGYHVGNLLLHVAGTLLIWAGLRKLRIPGAFLAALIFAAHPVNVESAAWISQRKDMLAVTFFLISILLYLKAEMSLPIIGTSPGYFPGGSEIAKPSPHLSPLSPLPSHTG